MRNFEFYTPTRVVFGRDAEAQTGRLVKDLGCKKVLLHYGGGSARRSGLLDRIIASLKSEEIEFVELGGVVPNPRLSKVNEGIALSKREGVDFILAVGGGSVIDSAKAIGYGIANEGDVWDFYMGERKPSACAPIGAVLTIAAAGSEMSDSSVITNENGMVKRGCSNDLARCKFAAMNPELTFSLPQYQTESGCVDIMMHTLERYFTPCRNSELNDALAFGLLSTVVKNAKILMREPRNYDARAEIMWAGSLSHNGVTGDRFIGDWSCHQLEHELSGMFDVAHGAGLAAIWGSWARYVYKSNPERFADLGENVFGCASPFAEDRAIECIEAMEAFFEEVEMPTSISKLGINLDDAIIRELADKCSWGGRRKLGAFKRLDKNDMENIYAMAR